MKMILSLILMAFGASAMADTYECFGVDHGEKIELNLDFSLRTGSLELSDRGLLECASTRFHTIGDVTEYGQAELQFDCRGSVLSFVRDHDEQILDLGLLSERLGLTESTYMCHP